MFVREVIKTDKNGTRKKPFMAEDNRTLSTSHKDEARPHRHPIRIQSHLWDPLQVECVLSLYLSTILVKTSILILIILLLDSHFNHNRESLYFWTQREIEIFAFVNIWVNRVSVYLQISLILKPRELFVLLFS